MRTSEIENVLPPPVMDIIQNLRRGGDQNYEENLAQRLEIIAAACSEEVERFREKKRRTRRGR